MTNPAPADDITLPAMPEGTFCSELPGYIGYPASDLRAYARAAVIADRASSSRAAVPAPGDGIIAIGGGPAEAVSAHATITKIIDELRTYSPEADEYMGRHILKGWANQLESVAPPHISETDEQYWLRHRSTILAAIEKRGFSLVSSGGYFWLGEKAPAQSPAPAVQVGAMVSTRLMSDIEDWFDEIAQANWDGCVDQGVFSAAGDLARRIESERATVPAAVDVGAAQAETALRQVLDVTRRYLPPGGPSALDAMAEIIAVVDPWPLGRLERKS